MAYSHAAPDGCGLSFLFPVDGDMLTERDGEVRNGRLHITVRIAGPGGRSVRVNGTPAREENGVYLAEIALADYRCTIAAAYGDGEAETGIVAYWLRQAAGKYRLSVDDAIWFLRDIARHSDTYRSIFDNPYLAVFKEAHDKYGAKVQFNVYYQTDGFDLTQMPDKFKPEWRANADWIRLTFHALQNDPPKPYKHASAAEVAADCERVTAQIVRFAGEELLEPATTVHWGEATLEGCLALRKFGFRGLAGYFRLVDGEPIVSYYLDRAQTAHVGDRDFWKDHSTDIVFVKIDAVLDRLNLGEIVPALERMKTQPGQSAFADIMIHEQYYYSHYQAYQPEYRDKVLTAARWAAENGYEPAFLGDSLFA